MGPLLRGKEKKQKPSLSEMEPQSSYTKRLLQIWHQLQVHNGVLSRLYPATNNTQVFQLVIPRSLQENVLTDLHDGALGGHLGVEKTLARLKERYYWPGHHTDVSDWCRNCPVCAARKNPNPKQKAPLQSVKSSHPLEIVAVDILGPFPEAQNGNKYILVACEYFTRWVEAYVVRNQEAKTIAEKLMNEFFFRFGLPEQLHSDQGRNFEADIIKEICTIFEIKKSRTTPYHPQSDGLVERMNRTLLDMLAIAVQNKPTGWDSHLRRLCIAYNTSVQPTTGFTSFYLMYGRQAKMLLELMYGSPNPSQLTLTDYLAQLKQNLEDAYRQVRERMGLQLHRQKELYDQRIQGKSFESGDTVWLHCPAVPRGSPRKLHKPWKGS